MPAKTLSLGAQSASLTDTNARKRTLDSTPSQTFTLATYRIGGDTQNIGTTAEAVNLGSIVAPTYIRFHNLDTTNFVTVGHWDGATYHAFAHAGTEETSQWIHVAAGVTLYAKADTGACEVDFELIEL